MSRAIRVRPSTPWRAGFARAPRGVVRTLVMLALMASILGAAACGIDTPGNSADGSSTTPDISGLWTGAFVGEIDGLVHTISTLAIVKTETDRFRFDFDVASKTPEGANDPEGLYLDTLLNAQALEAKIDDQRAMFLSARDGDLVLNGTVSNGAKQIDGDWLQVSPVDDHGTWSVARLSP